MTKDFCDRCGGEIPAAEHEGGGFFSTPKTRVTFSRVHNYQHYTLCNACEAEAHDFLGGKPDAQ